MAGHQDTLVAKDFDPLELDRYSTIQQLSRALAESANDLDSIKELLAVGDDGSGKPARAAIPGNGRAAGRAYAHFAWCRSSVTCRG